MSRPMMKTMTDEQVAEILLGAEQEADHGRDYAAFVVDEVRFLASRVLALAAEASRLRAAAEAVDRDASGRSGGSVYMVHREQMLALRAALRPAAAPGVQSQVLETESGYDGPPFPE